MRITVKRRIGQFTVFLCLFSLCACSGRRDDTPLIPPLTSPLSRDYIGFGVITASFTHLSAEPSDDSPSIGYLRRGSLVRITRRQTIRVQNAFVSWVFTDGKDEAVSGWLKEEVMDIYQNERQARTASEAILR